MSLSPAPAYLVPCTGVCSLTLPIFMARSWCTSTKVILLVVSVVHELMLNIWYIRIANCAIGGIKIKHRRDDIFRKSI